MIRRPLDADAADLMLLHTALTRRPGEQRPYSPEELEECRQAFRERGVWIGSEAT
jgi:hypothetical protein